MQSGNQFGSKLGFILSAAGSAIGLGAVWKFPYMTAHHGGGAFLFIFILLTLLIGLPLLLAEFVLGRSKKTYPVKTFELLGGKKHYKIIGMLGQLAVLLLLSFYSVIGGWILIYIVLTIGDIIGLNTLNSSGDLFNSVIGHSMMVIVAQGAFIFITALIVGRGIESGIEKASKIMMPLLFVSFIIIVIRSLTLDGAMEGVQFFLQPNFSSLSSESLIYALGQSFFALSLGVTGMMTYAAYLDDETSLVNSGISIVSMNIVISILAGLAIFPATFALGIDVEEGGPGLLFIVLPQVFEQIPFGTLFYLLFLMLFLFATLTSALSMIEINVSNVIKEQTSKRMITSMIIGLIAFIIGVPSALSFGVLGDVQLFGKSIFDTMDYSVSNILLPVGALLITLFVGYIMDKNIIKSQLNVTDSSISKTMYTIWMIIIRFVLPIIIIFVFLNNLIN
ncbi:sodium-dependent transporter [Abyssicoccus albus]|uniref:sodium-dependent transporter n=1 Tax=Abyssicoccus albus TaxID=1817405 RepID=UPI00097E3BD3|nr:sodium-dependent transporter [Abyssicoccus albus]AQL55519.1 sodium-dependent transporter [Abyssicoccus albus]